MNLDDYVDVAERIRIFKERYPDGSLQSFDSPRLWHIGERIFVGYCAAAYRTPDDERPGIGWAWEPVPGPTAFTKDSELMNAETSAWGRAIVALGIPTKKIASSNEVQNRQGNGNAAAKPQEALPATEKPYTKGQLDELNTHLKILQDAFPEHPGPGRGWKQVAQSFVGDHFKKASVKELTQAEMNELIRWAEDEFNQATKEQAVPFS